jgi:hypothetical protein
MNKILLILEFTYLLLFSSCLRLIPGYAYRYLEINNARVSTTDNKWYQISSNKYSKVYASAWQFWRHPKIEQTSEIISFSIRIDSDSTVSLDMGNVILTDSMGSKIIGYEPLESADHIGTDTNTYKAFIRFDEPKNIILPATIAIPTIYFGHNDSLVIKPIVISIGKEN